MSPRTSLVNRHADTVLAVATPPLDLSHLRYDYEQIDEAHRQTVMEAAVHIHDDAKRAQNSLIAIGERLNEVKEMLPHGKFGEWIKAEFGLSERMAQNMMNVAREYGDPQKRNSVADFSDGALYMLAAKSTPPAARAAIEAKAAATGKPPTRAEVKRVIEQYKPPTPPPAKVVYVEPQETLKPAEPVDVRYEVASPTATETERVQPASTLEQIRSGSPEPRPAIVEKLINTSVGRQEFRLALIGARLTELESALAQIPLDEVPRREAIKQTLSTLRSVEAKLGAESAPTETDASEWDAGAVGLKRDWTEEEFDDYAAANEVVVPSTDDQSPDLAQYLCGLPVIPFPFIPGQGPMTNEMRLETAKALREVYKAAIRGLLAYQVLIGKYTQTAPVERALHPMIDDLNSFIKALEQKGNEQQ